MNETNTPENKSRTIAIVIIFIAFLTILFGLYTIHPGLVLVACGLYLINNITNNSALINVYLQMPRNFKDVEDFLDILKDDKENDDPVHDEDDDDDLN